MGILPQQSDHYTPDNNKIVRFPGVAEDEAVYDATPRRSLGFAMIPRAVLELHDGYCFGVYAALVSFANKDGVCWPSLKSLGDMTGWSDRHILRVLKRLEESGLIERQKRFVNGMRSSTLYRIVAEDQIRLTVTTLRTTVVPVVTTSRTGTDSQSHKLEPIELDPIELTTPLPPKGSAPSKSPKYPAAFESFWRDYPSGHGVKTLTFKAWQNLTTGDRALAHAAIDVWRKSDKWQRGYVREAQRWLSYREWEQAATPHTNGHREWDWNNPDDVAAYKAEREADRLRTLI